MQIKSRFKISPSLVIVVQSWKSRFKICQSQELEVQVESRFQNCQRLAIVEQLKSRFKISQSQELMVQKRKSF